MNRKTGVILSYVSMIFEVMSTLLLTPYMIRTLGQAEFGVYKLSAAITAYLMLLDLGVGNAIIRYISKYRAENNRKKERQFFAVASIFYGIIGVFAIIGGIVLVLCFPSFFATGLSNNEIILGQKLLFITSLNCAITLATACYNNILIAYECFTVSKGCSIVSVILKMLFVYLALELGMGSVGIVVVTLILTIFTRAIMGIYIHCKLKLKPLFGRVDSSFVKEIVAYSSLILVQMVATQLNSTVDQILLGKMVQSSAIIIGIYGIGTQIVQYYQSIGNSFTGVLMPGVVRMIENKIDSREITNEMIRIGRIMFMSLGIIWCGFFVNGQNFIVLWAGRENKQAFFVAVMLMLMELIVMTESIGSQILWAMNEHKEQAYLKLLIVLANIFLTIALIRWEPLIGATVGTVISMLLGDIVLKNWLFHKKFGFEVRYYVSGILKGICPCLIISTLTGLFTSGFFHDNWTGLICKICIMILVYIITMLKFGLNVYEKKLIYSIIPLKIKKHR